MSISARGQNLAANLLWVFVGVLCAMVVSWVIATACVHTIIAIQFEEAEDRTMAKNR